jgi:chromosome segregation ATPase
MNQTPRVILSPEGALQYLIDRQEEIREEILAAMFELREEMVTVNQGVQDALNRLSGEISDLGDSVDRALTAATATNDALEAEIANLQAMLTSLQANDDADQAMISQLQSTIAALQAAQESQATDVVAQLDSLTTALDSIDSKVDAAGGATPPPPPPPPAPEEPAEPTPEEPEEPAVP